jgi:cytochrome c-type biogenesis protein CcmF
MNIHFIGEHLLPGIIGKSFVWISFAAAIASTVLYIINARRRHEPLRNCRKLARGLFTLHVFSLLSVVFLLYYVIFNHYFEYSYVWQYSSKTLPVKYIISCFWAGQEGSFLTWAVFQALIGLVLIRISRSWEDHVLSIVSLSQVFVTSMMLGVTVFTLKIGTSPFVLLREVYVNSKETIFQMPDYLSMITDGNGLNPLLENIWMTIHPPILFLGYALALVPFAYAISGLLRKEYTSWIKPALPWTLLSLTLLGAGILLGGAWAYVSLTFGGFWSWDPVENSSLVPWMTLVAGLHFLIIARKQRYALLSAFIMITMSYVLVLYASFLTRSGVLADTSAHSFGDNGMTAQLLVFLIVFLLLSILFIVINSRKFGIRKSEVLLSREFIMFLGSVILVLSAFQIIFTTSLPVFNNLFHTNIAPPADRVAFYNRWQAPYTLLIAGFIALSQFLHYNVNSGKTFLRKLAIPLAASLILVLPFVASGILHQANLIMTFVFVIFSICASVYNLIFESAGPRNLPAIITHTGFLLFVMGTIMTFSNSKIISTNTSRYDLGDTKANAENLLLMKGDTLYMGGFYAIYTSEKQEGNTTTYNIDFLKRKSNGPREEFVKEFSLKPSVNRNPRMGDVYNPDTRHLLWKDYYTYIASVGKNGEKEYIVLKAIMNPYINVLWLGAVVMVVGFAYAFWRRARRRLINSI